MENYTIAKMFRDDTPWNAYRAEDASTLYQFALKQSKDSPNYKSLETALLAQNQTLDDGLIAFPLKVIARFDAERKAAKKNGTQLSKEYVEHLGIALGRVVRVTNGSEIRRIRQKRFNASDE